MTMRGRGHADIHLEHFEQTPAKQGTNSRAVIAPAFGNSVQAGREKREWVTVMYGEKCVCCECGEGVVRV